MEESGTLAPTSGIVTIMINFLSFFFFKVSEEEEEKAQVRTKHLLNQYLVIRFAMFSGIFAVFSFLFSYLLIR